MKRRNLREDDFPPGTKEIYNRLLTIEVKTGPESIFPNEYLGHKFPKGVKVYGLKDGSILIKSKNGKRLWDEFDYDE